jgi:nucleotide-binding universal stress UspA family protein
MLDIKRILYPTDFSRCASHAMPCTRELARRFNAELHLFHSLVIHEADPGNAAHRLPNMEELYGALEVHAETQMLAATDGEAGTGFTVKRAQSRGISAAAGILDYAAENNIDLIVMGTHGRRGLRRLLLGSVAEEIVRLAPCPVMTVPEKKKADPDVCISQIVVPVDFSEHARLALNYAKELSALFEAQLHLIHIVDEVVYPDFYPPVMPSGGSVTDELRGQSIERLSKLLTETDTDAARTEIHVRAGRAAPEIADFTSEIDADLIVIASHGLTEEGPAED